MPATNRPHEGEHTPLASAVIQAKPVASSAAPVGALRQFARKREPTRVPREYCELCGTVLAPEHRHLLDLSTRGVTCSCDACSILFGKEGASEGKYRVIPRLYRALPDFAMTDAQWDELMIPVNMVYLFKNSVAQRVMAFYPSPAGATESLLSLESWEMLARSNPVLHKMEPDVEALLINRVRDARQYSIVPIDACYRLVGLIRLSWRGLSGGEEAWNAIADFFADVQKRAAS